MTHRPAVASATIEYSSFRELHDFLTREAGLLAEPEHSGSWRTYFYSQIVWHPLSRP